MFAANLRNRTARLVRVVGASLIALAVGLAPLQAFAWKPKTHVYLAEEAMRDADIANGEGDSDSD